MDSNVLKYLLIGVGAYILYEKFVAPNMSIVGGTPGTTSSSGNTTNISTHPGTTVDIKALLTQQIIKDGYDPNGMYTWDQMNYFYRQVRGVDAPVISKSFPGYDSTYKFTVDEWVGGETSAGLMGLGFIAKVDPYVQALFAPRGAAGPAKATAWEKSLKTQIN